MSTEQPALLQEAYRRALGNILARVCFSGRDQNAGTTIAVAYSGGLDSAVLLDLAHSHARAAGLRLLAFHVHHGLSVNADAWLQQAGQACERLGVPLHAKRVTVPRDGSGVEQGARLQRYQALGHLCREHSVDLLLTAHHLDDQAETVLLQLLRGTGVAGLGGMEEVSEAPGLLGSGGILIGRPLLGVRRAELEDHARRHGIAWVEDESNQDLRFARNAVRHAVMPALARHFPGCQERLARAAEHARSAQRVLDDVAAEDLARCSEDGGVRLEALAALGADRTANMLRYWFAARGMRMPSTAWLEQMLIQVRTARDDARVRVVHPDGEVQRHRGRLLLVAPMHEEQLAAQPQRFRWQGEETIRFARFGGSMRFSAGTAPARAWLAEQELELRHRSGGETLKLAFNRPGRSLKQHYQALGIPAWQRLRLPLLLRGGQLLYAAGIGINHAVLPAGLDLTLEWIADDS